MTSASTSTLNAQTGEVIETQDLVTYQSLGITRGLTLRYASTNADPRPILHFRTTGTYTSPQRYIAKLNIRRGSFSYDLPGYTGNQYGLTGGEHLWSIPANSNGTFDGALQVDLSQQPSGTYQFYVRSDVQPFNAAAPQFTPVVKPSVGIFNLINRVGSPFGNGWALVGWQEVISNPDGSVLLLDGDGTQLLFDPPATSSTLYTSPAGDFSRLERVSGGTLRRTLTDRTVYDFNTQGKLASVQDRVGNVTRYTYDAGGLLTQIIDPVNQTTSFTYTNNRVTRIDHPGGRQTRLEYDPATTGPQVGNLTKITHPDNAAYSYTYDSNRRMTASIDANGNRGEAVYKFAGRAISGRRRDRLGAQVQSVAVQSVAMQGLYEPSQTTNPISAPAAFSPNAIEAVTPTATTTDGNGNVTTMQLNQQGKIVSSSDGVGALPTQTYNAQNLISQITNARGQATNYTYDSLGNLTRITDSVSGSNGRQYTYEATFNLVTRVTDELGRQTIYAIDSNNGNLLTQTQVVGAVGGADDRVTRYTYTTQGLVNTITDPLGRITDLDYDTQGRLITVTLAMGTTDQTIQRYTYDGAGNVATFTDALNQQTKFFYDNFNRLIRVEQPDPDGTGPLTGPITQFSYDPNGNLIQVQDAVGQLINVSYDALNRQIRVEQPDPDGSGPLTRPVTVYAYDAGGRLTRLTDPLNQVTQYGYDARDRLITLTDARNQITRYAYDLDDNQISVTTPLNQVTQFAYDARDRLTSQTDALNRLTSFAYDAVDNLLSLTDPLNNITRYTYDALNQVTVETNPLNFTRRYEYDLVGNLTKLTDRNGRVRTFGYDRLNRRTTETWLNSTGGVMQTITATYDLGGRLTRITDPNATYTHTYDALNRVTVVDNTGTPGIPATRLASTYNGINNRLSLQETIASQARGLTNFAYDGIGRLVSVSQSGTGIASKRAIFGHDGRGQMTRISRYASTSTTSPLVETTLTYGATGLTTQVQHRLGSTLLSDSAWSHDAGERVTQLTSPDGSSTYSYDLTDQLTGADYSFQTDETYSYDTNGNRTNTGYVTGTNNRLTTDGRLTYTYDNEGNRIQTSRAGEIVTYTWDHRNRLTRVETRTTAGGAVIRSAAYTYDAFDRRISKTVDPDGAGPTPATIERFVYDRDHIWLVFDGSNTLTRRYFYGPAIDMVLAEERSATTVLWPLTDHQGTIRDITDHAGVVQNHIMYNSFGQNIRSSNGSVVTRFFFTGREFDGEIGLYFYRSRYYDPAIGRFIGEDGIGFEGRDANLYRYVGNSPTNFTDPFGQQRDPVWPANPLLLIQAGLILKRNQDGIEIVKRWRADNKNRPEQNDIDALRRDDLYFHCKGNCEATQAGFYLPAKFLCDAKEFKQCKIDGRKPKECADDQEANAFGRRVGLLYPQGSCIFLCTKYRPRDLPHEFW